MKAGAVFWQPAKYGMPLNSKNMILALFFFFKAYDHVTC